MSAIFSRTSRGMSTYVSVEISPATTTRPVVISVSQATRPLGSSPSTASSTESEIWSAILSGWPSVTDSEVKRNSRAAIGGREGYLRAPHEVDRHGHALELEPFTKLVLDPVAVVARDQTGVVDEEAEARRSRPHLRPIE